ncbi:MAG: tyrosine-type recombinase/integrase [Chloroflexi bacterium]|nr:tyrosine-type recombinase/integrase [Chloroflexota bacterium]
MTWSPRLTRQVEQGDLHALQLGHPLVDAYLAFVGARTRRNTWLATAYDLLVFFSVVRQEPAQVTTAEVFRFLEAQRAPRRDPKLVRLEDGEAGLAIRTIKRRLASVSGFFAYLLACGDAGLAANPVPRGLATRRAGARPGVRGVPLLRALRTLPRVVPPDDANAFLAALRTHRDRAMAEAMLFGGLRRCEVLGLRLRDVSPGERRVFVADGKGGHQRVVPISPRFFTSLAAYLTEERPPTELEHLFLALKGPHRGAPLTPAGLDETVRGACARAGIRKLTCHQLRHTCFTRLREAGMALEAVQAQAGHRSIESTRVYLPLTHDWLAAEYRPGARAAVRGRFPHPRRDAATFPGGRGGGQAPGGGARRS